MVNVKEKNQYSSIYCIKFIGAIFVILIHCAGLPIIQPVIRIAVPIFFMISGFFLFSIDKIIFQKNCLKAIKKLFFITLYANVFYYIAFFIPDNLFPFRTLTEVLNFIFVGNQLGMHLWYLNAIIEGLILIYFFITVKSINILWCLIPFFILLGLLLGEYHFLCPYLPHESSLSRNAITIGIPCIGIGCMLRQYSNLILRKIKYIFFIFLITLMLAELEGGILINYNLINKGDFYIMTIPLAAIILLLCIKYPRFGLNSWLEKIGKKYATNIYIFHVFILYLIDIVRKNDILVPGILVPILTLVLTLFFIEIWGFLSKKMFRIFN